jgi:CheY-like chemotaxis protein
LLDIFGSATSLDVEGRNQERAMPLNVLLVEDNPPDVFLVRQALREHGLEFALHEISDAEEALAYIDRMGDEVQTPCPDVVLLDLNIPKGDGLELLEAVRNSLKCPKVPIIVISSSAAPQDHSRVTQGGATRYFRKPIELDQFLKLGSLVTEVLNHRSA